MDKTTERCPECREPTARHVQARNCVAPTPTPPAANLWDLPIFGRMWEADGLDRRA